MKEQGGLGEGFPSLSSSRKDKGQSQRWWQSTVKRTIYSQLIYFQCVFKYNYLYLKIKIKYFFGKYTSHKNNSELTVNDEVFE